MRILPACALTMLATGCAPLPPVVAGKVDFEPARRVEISQFPGAKELLAQAAAANASEMWGPGKAALLGVEIHVDGEVDRRLLLIEVAPSDDVVEFGRAVHVVGEREVVVVTEHTLAGSPPRRQYELARRDIRVRHCDADGQLRNVSSVCMYDASLRSGLWGRCFADQRLSDLGGLFVEMLQDLAIEDEALRALLFSVVEPPSAMSVMLYLGVTVHLRWEVFPTNVQWSDLVWGDDLVPVGLQISINGTPSLVGGLLVQRPTGGMMACGGLCGAVLKHPDDPQRWVALRLLGVWDGAEPATSQGLDGLTRASAAMPR